MTTGWADRLSRPLPRPVAFVGGPLVFLLLVAFFVYLGFPYDRVAELVTDTVRRSGGVELEVRELGPHLSWGGPGFQARDVVARAPGGPPVRLDVLRVRPAWSTSWLRAEPALHLSWESPLGGGAGAVVPGERAFDGRLRDVDLGSAAVQAWLPVPGLDGRLDAEGDLSLGGPAPAGELRFSVREGSLLVPETPVAVPFESLEGEVVFGDGALLTLRRLELQGPVLAGSVQGTVGAGPGARWDRAALDLEAELDAREPMARDALRSAGVRLGRSGRTTVRIRGTTARPEIR